MWRMWNPMEKCSLSSIPPSLPPTVFWWVLEWLTPVFPFKIRFSINLVKCSYKNCPNCRNFVGKKSVPKTKNYYFIYFYMRIFGRWYFGLCWTLRFIIELWWYLEGFWFLFWGFFFWRFGIFLHGEIFEFQ